MIEIYIGPYVDKHILATANAILNDVTSYPNLRLQIRDAIQHSKSLLVLVNEPICYEWFWDLQSSKHVKVHRISPLEQLGEKLKVPVLPELLHNNPELIMDWNLLEVSEPIFVNESVIDWILRTRLGSVWTVQLPQKRHLTQLLDWFATNKIENNFLELAREKLEFWSNNAQERALRIAYKELLESPEKKVITLACHHWLRNYPTRQVTTWLNSKAWFSDKLLMADYVDIEFVSVPRELQDINSNISTYWQTYFTHSNFLETFAKSSNEDRLAIIEDILLTMSCRLESEIEALTTQLLKVSELLPHIVSSQISLRFSPYISVDQYIEKIEQALPPKYPDMPETVWGEVQWLDWAVNQYIPYRKWMIFNNRENAELDELSMLFEVWIFENYPKLIARTSGNLVGNTSVNVKKLLHNGQRVLWFFIDNLSYIWYSNLLDALNDEGFHIEISQPQIAMIPSITEVSRPVSLIGDTPVKNFQQGLDNWQNLPEAIKNHWTEYNVKVAKEFDELESSLNSMPDMIVFVYNRLDELMHTNMPISDRRDETYSTIKRICKKLKSAAKKLSQAGDVSIIISTDHGCTAINNKLSPLELPTFIHSDPSLDLHRRYVRFEARKQLDEAAWFVFDPKYYELPEFFAVPRGRRSVSAFPKGFTHGGLTPEEMVVPNITCKLGVQREIRSVGFSQISPLRAIERQQKLILEIVNPLDIKLTNLEVTIPTLKGIFETIPVLEDRTTKHIEALVIIPPSCEDIIEVAIIYQALDTNGRKISGEVLVNLTMNKIYTSEIDDLFGL